MRTMRKLLALLLTLALLLILAGCAGTTEQNESPTKNAAPAATTEDSSPSAVSESPTKEASVTDQPEQNEPQAENIGSDILVVYFSRTGEQYSVGIIDKGNTAIIAEMIAEQTGADLFEVLPEEDYYPYTYDELTDVAKKEQAENARPAYRGTVPNLADCSTVFIGAPVWWGDWPMILYTFFENEDLSGKTLIPFSTHEGSGLSGFDKKLASACPASTVLDGLAIRGSDAQNKQDSVREKVSDWLSDLGY